MKFQVMTCFADGGPIANSAPPIAELEKHHSVPDLLGSTSNNITHKSGDVFVRGSLGIYILL